jgi:hypothetical protein
MVIHITQFYCLQVVPCMASTGPAGPEDITNVPSPFKFEYEPVPLEMFHAPVLLVVEQ